MSTFVLRVSGAHARVLAGYQTAFDLSAWSIVPSDERPRAYVFSAAVTSEHPIWVTMPPFDLIAMLGAIEWRWTNVSFTRVGGVIEILLTEYPVVRRGTV